MTNDQCPPTTGDSDPGEGAIEAHLDELFRKLAGHPAGQARHLLAEAEAHLRDAAAEEVARGLDPSAAEARAVARFGPIGELVHAEQRRHATPITTLVRCMVSTGLLLGSLGAIAVGLSGVLAGAMGHVEGSTFVVDRPAANTLRAADCSRWLAARPQAPSCAVAAQADWVDETIWYRVGLGVLGVIALLVFVAIRRRLFRTGQWGLLPSVVVNTIAAVVFGGAGLWLSTLGADAIAVSSGHGAGQWLSAAPIALVLGIAFSIRLIRDLRAPIPPAASA